ncbi:MEROPS serine peptidase family S33, partial [Rhizoctonia solani]
MVPSLIIGATALAAVVRADPWSLPEGYHRYAPRAEGFNWGECPGNFTGRECSRFEVPLDWANHSVGKATLAVARYKATKEPKLGTLFVNPGGPSGSGVELILSSGAERISEMAGDQYDVVSWDPRGVGLTVPRADCFKTGTEENAFWEGTIPRAGLEARGNFTDQRDLDAFYEQEDEVDVLLEELGKRCVAYSPDTFQYIGTAAAARDMVAMHDVLEGSNKPVDYWGLSYGTVVGIYFVNMFPDRVGRVVLDGVVDPEYWANRPAHEMWRIKTESTDEALTGFLTACAAAGPSGCALATKNSTTDSLRQLVRDLINAAYDYKRENGPGAEIGSAMVRMAIYRGLYTPSRWPAMAEEGAKYVEAFRNLSLLSNSPHKRSLLEPLLDIVRRQTSNNGTSNNDPAPDYSFQGVTCADAVDAGNTTTRDVFDFLVKVTREVSPMFGPQWGDGGLYCHRWPVRAVERYTGPWNKKLSNPILVIGNEADPVTPYISAKKVADALGDSAILIEQDDYGHLSLAMHSTCTISALQDYFLNNKLPSQDKLCGVSWLQIIHIHSPGPNQSRAHQTNQQLFPGPGVTKSTISKLNVHNSATDPSSLEDELDKARERSDRLFILVITLAAASGLLLLGLIFSCIRGRRKSKLAHATYIPRGAFEKGGDEQGHIYDPYGKGSGSKSGGYARVET